MYYPKSKIQENQYTSGGFTDPSGKPYKGLYHITYDGNNYTGATHTSDSQLLTKISPADFSDMPMITPGIISNMVYDQITGNKQEFLKDMVIPLSYYPVLSEQDYVVGFFTRYFVKRVGGTNRNIYEISPRDVQKLATNNLYNTTSLDWKLTGPVHDEIISSSLTIYGIFDTNSRMVYSKQLSFPGLSDYLINFLQFARII